MVLDLNDINHPSYRRTQRAIDMGNLSGFTNEEPPEPPVRNHSSISKSSRNGEYGRNVNQLRSSKSSSRNNSAHDQIRNSLAEQTIGGESSARPYVDGGNAVVPLPHHSWTQPHRRNNQR